MSSSGASEMEDVKLRVDHPSPTGADDGEARLADLCKSNLGLDDGTTEEVINLLRECKPVLSTNSSVVGGLSPEEAERYWSASAIFCVTKLRDERANMTNGEGWLPLYRIVGTINISISGFFREVSQFLLKAGPVLRKMYGSGWEKILQVKEEQINFVHLKLLSSQYKSMWKQFFLSNDSNNVSTDTEFVSEHHRFGWLLFLALRAHAFSRFKDLVSCINGLISILAILILHVPVRFRRFSVITSTLLARKSERGLDLLASLCDVYQTSEADLKESLDKTNTLIVGILKKKPQPASECQVDTLAGIDTGGLTYFEDLMEDSSLQASLLVLEKDYDDAICKKGEIDERMFIGDDGSLLGSGSLSGGPINICRPKGNFGIMDSPAKTIVSPLSTPLSPASPANGNNLECMKVAHTPVSTTMTTAKWLRTVIAPLPSKPSKELTHFLASCDKDVTHDVTHRANIILEAIFPCRTFGGSVTGTLQNVAMMDNIWAEQRKMEALKLYYRVLEAICRAESHLLHAKNLTSLLSNERFHRCMLACSAELVLATHKTVTIMFPAVLERAGVTAFDLSKVIESFVRHEDSLPRELKRHLNSLEERLLESMVWEKGSSMYNSLIVARPSLSAEINHLGLLADPMPSLDSIAMQQNMSHGSLMSLPSWKHDSPDNKGDVQSPKRSCTEARNVLTERNSFTSPVKDRLLTSSSVKSKLPHLQSAFATPTRPNPAGGGETCAEAGINIFFSKIVKLAAIRIRWLCEKMQLPHQILERVYCFTQQILNQRTSLFFNRHIDQLILCSFYGVSKISQLNLTFKEIINNYKKQPQWKHQVFRSVFVDWSLISDSGKTSQDHVDIITFYNRVFIPSVKPLLVELDHGSIQRNNRLQENNINGDGQCPGSPRVSSFPTLPDMSPKKVSASHNVYVSPLRSSKMDTLLSPSSRSYYAFVGESTQAYQSPSKDLTAINNRLNCSSRKLRLNFDMVSDSLVAGSLCPQNGSSVPSSTSPMATVHPVVKSEQPDS